MQLDFGAWPLNPTKTPAHTPTRYHATTEADGMIKFKGTKRIC